MSLHDPDKCACATTDKLCAKCEAFYHRAVWKQGSEALAPLASLNSKSRRELRKSKPR